MRLSTLLILALSFCLMSNSINAQQTYTNRAAFEGDLDPPTIIMDDYSGYIGGPYNDAQMSAFFGETDYVTTRNFDINFTTGGVYCSGNMCEGSFQLSFGTTSITENGQGVCGVGFDYNVDPFVPYVAYVTYGNGTMLNYLLSADSTFFGVTSEDLVVSVHIGFGNGDPTNGDTFINLDNLTIGQCLDDADAVPSIPTLSQWGLLLFCLIFLTMGAILVYQRQLQAVAFGNRRKSINVTPGFQFPFDLRNFKQCTEYGFYSFLIGMLAILIGWGEITTLDIFGLTFSSVIIVYLMHLLRVK